MRNLFPLAFVPLLSGCLLTGDQYDDKYDDFFPDAVETDSANNNGLTFETVTLSGESTFTNDTLTATAEALDASNEIVDITYQQVTFEWHVIDADSNEDVVVQTGENNTLDGTQHFDRDDRVYVVGTFGAESVSSETVIVYNSPPTTPGIRITPASPVAGQDDVTCSILSESTDPDNDPVTYNYEWFNPIGDTLQRTSGADALDDVLSADLTTEGPLTCSVTPLSEEFVGISEAAVVDVEAEEGVCTSLYFNGNDHYLEVPASDDLVVGNAFTFESWLYWEGTHGAQYQIPFSYGWGSDYTPFRVHILDNASDCGGTSGSIFLSWNNNSIGCLSSTNPTPVGEWFHVAVVYSESEMSLYLNGRFENSASVSQLPDGSGESFYVGSPPVNLDNDNYDFHGHVAMAHLTNAVLYTTDFTPSLTPSADNSIFLFDFAHGEHLSPVDETGNFTYGVNGDVVWSDSCPQEAYCAFGDCDENLDLGNGFSIDFANVPSGDDPLSRYTLTRDFMAMTTEVTQGMFQQIMGYDSRDGQTTNSGDGGDYPAYHSSWHMAADFANGVTRRHNTVHGTVLDECYTCTGTQTSVNCSESGNPYTCTGYVLPTEAEWEYMTRSGTNAQFWTGQGSSLGGNHSANDCGSTVSIQDGVTNPPLGDYAWYCWNNNSMGSKEVATKLPNGFGLYDLHGNLWEWTGDWFGCTSYPNGATDPWCDTEGTDRMYRGGNFDASPESLDSSYRISYGEPTRRNQNIGFRLVRHP